jgi:hypothetical protein
VCVDVFTDNVKDFTKPKGLVVTINNSNSDNNDSSKTDQKLPASMKNSKNKQMQVKKKG